MRGIIWLFDARLFSIELYSLVSLTLAKAIPLALVLARARAVSIDDLASIMSDSSREESTQCEIRKRICWRGNAAANTAVTGQARALMIF
jgi:hypothetical protein